MESRMQENSFTLDEIRLMTGHSSVASVYARFRRAGIQPVKIVPGKRRPRNAYAESDVREVFKKDLQRANLILAINGSREPV